MIPRPESVFPSQVQMESDSDLMVGDDSEKSHSVSDLFEFRMSGFISED